jgi:hypothetical protein
MKIGILGHGWRKQMTEDMLRRAGWLAELIDGFAKELTFVCSVKPGEGLKIADFAKCGGNVILLYPERELLSLFGEELMYTHHFPLLKNLREELPFAFLQVFPPISLVRPAKCEIWAHFALGFTRSALQQTSRYPALAWRQLGKGRIAMFFYDLPSSILLFQQGREFWASDGDFPMPVPDGVTRACYLAHDLIQPALEHLPQAYFHELLLLALCRTLAQQHSPLPRVWPYPFPHTTALVLSGDSDGLDRKWLRKAWQKIVDWGGEYTQIITLPDLIRFPAAELAEWRAKGIDFGFHYYAGYQPSPAEMRRHFAQARKLFLKKRVAPKSCRGHSIVWVGWDEQVQIMEEGGMELSSNLLDYYNWGVSQGLPYPLYTRQGRSKVHELQSYAADDTTLYDKSGRPPLQPYEALLKMTAALNTMNEMYYQPIAPVFHPHYFANLKPDSSEWVGGMIRYAKSHAIPVMHLNRFFTWWKRRNAFLDAYAAGHRALDSKAIAACAEFGIALPERWNGLRLNVQGKRLRGTGEILLPLKDALQVKYE